MITGITVCVNYWDVLDLTIKKWKKFCDEIIIITDSIKSNSNKYDNTVSFVTNVFYKDGANFNKGLAIETMLNTIKTKDYICLFDADILLPDNIVLPELEKGKLYTPYRHIVPFEEINEIGYKDYPVYPESEFAGYFQLFHKDSLERPYYPVNWKHAGGCDSEFQARFKPEDKIRLPFNVYHLGEPGRNWNGRATPMLDGTLTTDMLENQCKQDEMFELRRKLGNYSAEKTGG